MTYNTSLYVVSYNIQACVVCCVILPHTGLHLAFCQLVLYHCTLNWAVSVVLCFPALASIWARAFTLPCFPVGLTCVCKFAAKGGKERCAEPLPAPITRPTMSLRRTCIMSSCSTLLSCLHHLVYSWGSFDQSNFIPQRPQTLLLPGSAVSGCKHESLHVCSLMWHMCCRHSIDLPRLSCDPV